MKKNSGLLVFVFLFFLLIGISFSLESKPSVSAEVIAFSPASGTYYPGDAVNSSLIFKNTGRENWTYWVGYSVQDSAGKWYDVPCNSATLTPGEVSGTLSRTWQVPSDALLTTGSYKVVMAVWKNIPGDATAIKLADVEKENAFQVSYFFENFTSFDTNRWLKSSYNLELSYLDPSNVDISNGNLRIKIPANTLNGGEIESTNFYKYGTYSAKMKLPNAPSSITGFFLYMEPDYYNEIDIEIYNEPNGSIMFTTYADGKKQHIVTKNLGFDPTADFHEYRFDFYPGNLSFFVDGKMMQRWTDGMTTKEMKFIVNTWYPEWLNGIEPTSDKYTLIDWIQH